MANIMLAVRKLTTERDLLQAKLSYAESTILELQRQTIELDFLLKRTQALLLRDDVEASLKAASSTASEKVEGSTWIGGTWLVVKANNALLGPTEKAWQQGKTQEALNVLTHVFSRRDLTPTENIEICLLHSAILRSAGQLDEAKEYAEMALHRSKKHQLYDLEGKAWFHQGLCYLYMDRYQDAHWCFVLASHTEGHAEQVAVNRALADNKLKATSSISPLQGISETL